MLSALILTSSGLADANIRDAVKARVDPALEKSVVMITTAAPEKEKSPYVQSDCGILKRVGFAAVDFLDVEKEDASRLRTYDAIYVSGGNTFYLLYHLRKSGADKILWDMIQSHPIVYIGVSAGSIVAGKSIISSDDENVVGLHDLTGMELLDAIIVPHFGEKKETIRETLKAQGYRVVCLADGQALIVEHGKETLI